MDYFCGLVILLRRIDKLISVVWLDTILGAKDRILTRWRIFCELVILLRRIDKLILAL